jgi:carbamoyl-phosphate synthase large subunit
VVLQRKLHILLTSIGGLGVPKLIEILRAEADFDLTITGVDAGTDPIGAHFVDQYFRVPRASEDGYAQALLDVCSNCGVELVIPESDGEAVALAQAESTFAAAGFKVLCSPYRTTRVAANKYLLMCRLREHGVPVPAFHLVHTVSEAEAALAQLGFPERPVVFKPVDSAGARGFRIVCSGFDELKHVLNSKKETLLSAPRLLRMLRESPDAPEFLLMEYLAGDSFSTEVLVRDGRAAYIVPQRRVVPKHGSVEVAVLEPDAEIERCVDRILAAMPFRYIVNIDVGFRSAPREGGVFPYDINPRISGINSATKAAGCFLLAEAMRDAVGMESTSKPFRPTRMVRYWNEHYVTEDAGQVDASKSGRDGPMAPT